MSALDVAYTVVTVAVAVGGLAATLWITESPGEGGASESAATVLAVAVFVVALGASLL